MDELKADLDAVATALEKIGLKVSIKKTKLVVFNVIKRGVGGDIRLVLESGAIQKQIQIE